MDEGTGLAAKMHVFPQTPPSVGWFAFRERASSHNSPACLMMRKSSLVFIWCSLGRDLQKVHRNLLSLLFQAWDYCFLHLFWWMGILSEISVLNVHLENKFIHSILMFNLHLPIPIWGSARLSLYLLQTSLLSSSKNSQTSGQVSSFRKY